MMQSNGVMDDMYVTFLQRDCTDTRDIGNVLIKRSSGMTLLPVPTCDRKLCNCEAEDDNCILLST